GGDVVGTACNVSITEKVMGSTGSNVYSGKCTGAMPSADFPCMIRELAVTDTQSGPAISGLLLCDGIPLKVAPNDPAQAREVTAPGPDSSVPVSFRFTNCRGL